MSYIFNLRINNIAADGGCTIAKWTYKGAVASFFVELLSCILGLAILPLRKTVVMRNYNWSV